MPEPRAPLVARVMLRTSRTPLRPLWAGAYRCLMRGIAAYLRRGEPGTAVYLRGALAADDAVYGLSDLDLAVVVPGSSGRPGVARRRTLDRWLRVARPLHLRQTYVDLAVFETPFLRDQAGASTLTYDLDAARAEGRPPRAAYFGEAPLNDDSSLRERPGLYGPLADWRALSRGAGPGPRPGLDDQARRIAAWLELTAWWHHAFRASLAPTARHTPYICVKLVAEPARIWLWLARGERLRSRDEILARALRALPEEEDALLRARALLRTLPRSPEAPLHQLLPACVRLSARIARRLEGEVQHAGTRAVRLTRGEGELAVPPAAGVAALSLGEPERPARILPLADWRARAWPQLPDEAFVAIPGDPADPARLARAARTDRAVQPVLAAQGLIVLPTAHDWLLRSVQCRLTDPVSFALLAGAGEAHFPNVAGWSAEDSARRAVAEHRGWLESPREHAPATPREWRDHERGAPWAARALGRLFTAARAALFLESIESGEPELLLSLGALPERLAARGDGAPVVEAALESYRGFRLHGDAPSGRLVEPLRRRMLELPAYRR